ncbi:MAG: alpha/beta hydrolase [Parerythrobacter sp.]
MKKLAKAVGAIVLLVAVLVLVFRTPDTDPVKMRAKYGAAPSQFVEIDGQTVHLRDEGPRNAPVIVLLHGSNADLHTWQPWVDRLKTQYRVIRFDQIGHGLTGPAGDGDYSRGAFAADVEAVAAHFGLSRFVLAGNSLGGGIALEYAQVYPSRLSGLVLVDPSGAPNKEMAQGNLAFTLAGLPVVNQLFTQITPRSIVEDSLRSSVSNQAIVTPAAIDRYWELARIPGNRAAMLTRFAEPRAPLEKAEVATIRVPTLVMWGEEDSLIPFSSAGWFVNAIPDAELVSYSGIGHLPMEEAPDATAADLKDWMVNSALTNE